MALYTCARSRQTTGPLDRVYGIMQIWDFQLGLSAPGADRLRDWTLEELEIELGKHLLQTYPIESQLHIHTQSVTGRQAWRISSSSTIPHLPLFYGQSNHLSGDIDRHSANLSCRYANGITYGHFDGKVCSIDALRTCMGNSEPLRAVPRLTPRKEPRQYCANRTGQDSCS